MEGEKSLFRKSERGEGSLELSNSGHIFCSIRDTLRLWTWLLQDKRKRRRCAVRDFIVIAQIFSFSGA